ncbi:hypothetical protein DDM70_17065 [Vibrio cholerae]|uniref:hypothetical protein n=1 Tax=Gynuella sp. TaxID=2969146 RepID=UPI0029E9E262|nr:hypothetical protein [Vibrio cholerae]
MYKCGDVVLYGGSSKKQEIMMGEQKVDDYSDSKRLSVDIPSALHKHLKRLSIEQETTVRELVVRALEQQYRLPSNDQESSQI